jgi:putative PEP-CTERM system integral membrane protein
MKSEFAELSDLLISQGVKHSELLSEIHEAVLTVFRERYPKLPIGASVVVDEITGEVRIFSGEKDITPKEFAEEASSLARKVMISKLGNTQKQPQGAPLRMPVISQAWKNNVAFSWIANIFFWGYNLYFLAFGLISETNWLSGLFKGSFLENLKDIKPVEVFISLVLIATPVTAIVMTLRRKLYEKPGALGRIFFLFEIPVFLVATIPSMFGASTTPFVQFSTLALLGIPVVLYFFAIDSEIGTTGKKVLLFIQQAAFLIVAYFTLLFTFVAPLILGTVAKSLFDGLVPSVSRYSYNYGYYQTSVFESVLQLGFGVLIFGLVVLMVSLPYLLVLVLSRAMRKTFADLSEKMSVSELSKLQTVFALVVVIIAGATAYQGNNGKLLEQLNSAATATTFSEQEEFAAKLIPQEKKLEEVIKNYSKYRMGYWMSKNDNTLANGYEEVFDAEILGQSLQEVFIKVAYPLVYQGKDQNYYQIDSQFQYIFGRSVFETKTVIPATADKSVRLSYRKVNMTTDKTGLAAAISIEEEYENRTKTQQEVIYEFSLPTGSVVTELNLGPDLEFPGVISPKGAAQRTYEAQLQVRRDPALLEQVGPDQYRLRVFPIPSSSDFNTLKGRLQKVQFAYVTPITKDGFGLPNYYKMNNLLVNNSTPYLLTKNNGGTEKLKDGSKYIEWETMSEICKNNRSSEYSNSQFSAILSTNIKFGCVSDDEVLKAIDGMKIGIFYDVSTANKDSKTIDEIQKLSGGNNFLTRNTVDFYKYNQKLSDRIILDSNNLAKLSDTKFFGKSSIFSAATNFSEQYDLIIIATSNKADMSSAMNYPFRPNDRVYIIQDGQVPSYHSKLSTYLLQGNGGTVPTLSDALRDVATKDNLRGDSKQVLATTIGRYLTAEVAGISSAAELLNLAIKPASGSANIDAALVNEAMFKVRLAAAETDMTNDINVMDKFNVFAKEAGIVTPFSSYISLVNEQQRQQLEQFEESYNRYQEQAITTNNNNARLVTPPMVDVQFDQSWSTGPRFGISAPLGAVERSGPTTGFGMLTNPAMNSVSFDGGGMGVSGGSVGMLSGSQGFVILNAGVLGVGMLWYLLRLLRGQKPKK